MSEYNEAPGAAATATRGQIAGLSQDRNPIVPRRTRKKGSGKTGRVNRTPAELAATRQAVIDLVMDYGRPTTVRHVYYLAVTAGVGPKATAFYKDCIRWLSDARRAGDLPFACIVDNTRSVRCPATFDGPADGLAALAAQYRRNYWDHPDAPVQVQIWCEADTVAHIIGKVTHKYAVPFYCARGASSITFIRQAADAIEAAGRPAYVYWFGDWDKCGVDIFETCRADLLAWTPDTQVTMERVAVTAEQIERYGLLTHDSQDKHAREWIARTGSDQVCELDAMSDDALASLVECVIVQHIDGDVLHEVQTMERDEKQTLLNLAREFGGEI